MIEPASLTTLIRFPFALVFTYTFTKCVRRVQSRILEDFGILFSDGWWHQLKYINWIQLWDNSVIWDILACFRGLGQINLPKRKLKFGIKAWDTDDIRIQVAPGKFLNCLMHRSISNSNIPFVLKFSIFGGQIPVPQLQKAVQMPQIWDPVDGQMPHPRAIVLPVNWARSFQTGNTATSTNEPFLKKGISDLRSKATLSFYCSFLVSHSSRK